MYPNDMHANDEERLEQLPGDYDPPATPASDAASSDDSKIKLPEDDPRKDTDVDLSEAYDVGMDGASSGNIKGGSVAGYTPPASAPPKNND
jgi:hypothetical protein